MKPITRKQYADKLDAWIGKGQIIVLTGQRRVGKSKFVWKTGKWIAAGFQTRGIRTYTHIFRLQRRGTATGIYQAISVQRSSFNVKKMLPFRVFADALSIIAFIPAGSRTRGYSPFGLPVFQTALNCEPHINLCPYVLKSKNLTTHCSHYI